MGEELRVNQLLGGVGLKRAKFFSSNLYVRQAHPRCPKTVSASLQGFLRLQVREQSIAKGAGIVNLDRIDRVIACATLHDLGQVIGLRTLVEASIRQRVTPPVVDNG